MTLSGEEFLRRFVQHVLPRGFVKIRHYGLLANRQRAEKLHLCRRLLLPVTVAGPAADAGKAACDAKGDAATPAAAPHCPRCGGCRFVRFELPAEANAVPANDSS